MLSKPNPQSGCTDAAIQRGPGARPGPALKERYPRTPAMAAGVTDHIWPLEEIAGLLD